MTHDDAERLKQRVAKAIEGTRCANDAVRAAIDAARRLLAAAQSPDFGGDAVEDAGELGE